MKFKINKLQIELLECTKNQLILMVNSVEVGSIHKRQRCLTESDIVGIKKLVMLRLKKYNKFLNERKENIPTQISKLKNELEYVEIKQNLLKNEK